jgi:hypothetical protein
MSENTIKVDINHGEVNPRNLDIRIGGQLFDHSNTPLIDDGIGLVTRDYGLHEENGIVIFLDALGMRGIWRRFKPSDVIKMWNSVISFFKYSLDQNRIYLNVNPFFKVLSDTIIITIASKPSYAIISQTFDLLLPPFIQSIKTRMFLRGIVSYGTYYTSERLIIWPAIDDAAYYHDKLNWIGISLSPTLSVGAKNITTNSIVYYENIPHKDRPYRGFVLNWPNSDSDRKCHSILREESKTVDSPIKQKYDNTFTFYQSVAS